MKAVDDVVLARLEAAGIDIHYGEFELPPEGVERKEVPYETPYAVYYSSVGDDDRRRYSGQNARRSVFFAIHYIGETPEQAKWLGEKIAGLLRDRQIDVPGHKAWRCLGGTSVRIRRDDEVVRPDGSPLFYGVDDYAIAVTLPATPIPAP